jgi:hypothetical protein
MPLSVRAASLIAGPRAPGYRPCDGARRHRSALSRADELRAREGLPARAADHPLVLQDFVANHITTWPAQVKAYPDGLPPVGLPRDLPTANVPTTAVLTGLAPAPPLTLASVARTLFLSAGVVRTSPRSHNRTVLFRAAGSAGGRFPMELYVSARGLDGLTDGVYWYEPVGHTLLQVGPPRGREGDHTGRHRAPLAHGLALHRARLPAHLLGLGHDARPDARPRGRAPVHDLPR